MSPAVGRRLALAVVLLLATPLAASARPIEETLSRGLNLELVWNRLVEWLSLGLPRAVWSQEGTDIDPYGRPAPVPIRNQGTNLDLCGDPVSRP